MASLSAEQSASPPPQQQPSDGYLPPDWVVPPHDDWPPRQPSARPPRSRRRQQPQPRSDPAGAALDRDSTSASQSDADPDSDSDSGSDVSWTSTSSWDSELAAREAQLQWDESMRQVQALVNLVAVPWIARYFGRKWAYSCAFGTRSSPSPCRPEF